MGLLSASNATSSTTPVSSVAGWLTISTTVSSTPCSTATEVAGLDPSAAAACVKVYWPAGIPPKAMTPGALSKSLASLSHTSTTGTPAASVSVKQPSPSGLPSGVMLTTESIPVSTGCSAVATGSGVDSGVAVTSGSGVAVEVATGSGAGVSASGSRGLSNVTSTVC